MDYIQCEDSTAVTLVLHLQPTAQRLRSHMCSIVLVCMSDIRRWYGYLLEIVPDSPLHSSTLVRWFMRVLFTWHAELLISFVDMAISCCIRRRRYSNHISMEERFFPRLSDKHARNGIQCRAKLRMNRLQFVSGRIWLQFKGFWNYIVQVCVFFCAAHFSFRVLVALQCRPGRFPDPW
jgi:hypothetical protein